MLVFRVHCSRSYYLRTYFLESRVLSRIESLIAVRVRGDGRSCVHHSIEPGRDLIRSVVPDPSIPSFPQACFKTVHVAIHIYVPTRL